ncbi:ABC transporter permease subunit [Terracoccus luteus]|jgi:arabinogalactan oligomer/maltooligosaccharide transport system permease protein|uniref:Maltose/maltodextrin transport system permease protein n=1 Tax=Terracoccus luteus TaxID=53356 RepID=A0A495XTA6_9MICO|nr:ABC transporter permease subunit [Terracoccus luteus]MBB2986779.1 arabinogalactan oligomer/maltooligosaccharide transport system permease protein [Terracoccus luteus]MCP2172430.1 arabinogalactan oligomer/maltooligosaccharide transport system permease protein [Terracoccus luteus]RKT76829.1 carbohydrate ABC transporter membrane protein 1 (CUT1 family) [Terracoccus luteus]
MSQATKASPAQSMYRTPLWASVLKWVALAVVVAAAFVLATRLADQGYTLYIVVLALVVMAVLAVYSTRRAIPAKYLLPGLVLLLGLQVWPIVMTVSTAFTNGQTITKEDTIAAIQTNSVQEVQGSPRYKLSIAVPEGGDVASAPISFLLTAPDGTYEVGDKDGLKDLPAEGVQKTDSGKITAAPGWTVLNARQVNARKDLATFAVPTADGGGIKASGLSEAFEGKATITYDAATDQLRDSATGKVYVVRDARFVPQDGQGQAFPQKWAENVGFKNFQTILTDPTIRSGFLKIFTWNVVFAALSVITTFILGMLLALLFNDERLKGKGYYRALLVLPYAIPGFVTSLLWKNMFNQEFGLINSLTGLNVDWLGDATAAKAAILITNLWLGFPYMFLICTGALQSIPADVREAAKIDGASAGRTLRSIIMPLLLVAVGPLLIASFAFNFNNFGLIFLLTGGGPFESDNTSIGSSDLLITYAFRLAFSGVTPDYGLAAAVSIFIFVIVALMSYAGFRRTKGLEEVN